VKLGEKCRPERCLLPKRMPGCRLPNSLSTPDWSRWGFAEDTLLELTLSHISPPHHHNRMPRAAEYPHSFRFFSTSFRDSFLHSGYIAFPWTAPSNQRRDNRPSQRSASSLCRNFSGTSFAQVRHLFAALCYAQASNTTRCLASYIKSQTHWRILRLAAHAKLLFPSESLNSQEQPH
jgi:hypothetical protein